MFTIWGCCLVEVYGGSNTHRDGIVVNYSVISKLLFIVLKINLSSLHTSLFSEIELRVQKTKTLVGFKQKCFQYLGNIFTGILNHKI